MRQSQHAHTGQQTQIQKIVQEALRNATLAETYQDALDVAGAALRRIADLSRGGVSRG